MPAPYNHRREYVSRASGKPVKVPGDRVLTYLHRQWWEAEVMRCDRKATGFGPPRWIVRLMVDTSSIDLLGETRSKLANVVDTVDSNGIGDYTIPLLAMPVKLEA